ncbi:MAG: nucleoside-diphosphate kinase, partial [Tepidimonas sp.]
ERALTEPPETTFIDMHVALVSVPSVGKALLGQAEQANLGTWLKEGENAIAKNRELMGATDPKKAAPGTIRADFADSIDANAVHGSDAPETAAVEVAFFFPGMNIYSR